MRARDIMTRDPVTVFPGTAIRDAAALLAEHRITSMPVVDDLGQVVGIVSELDLLRDRMPHDPRSTLVGRADGPDPSATVRDVMTETVVCMPDGADLADLAAALVDDRIRAVPILDGHGLAGIVSRRDVLRTLLRDDTAITAEALERLADYQPDTTWQVKVHDGVVTVDTRVTAERERRVIEALLRTVPGVVRVHI